MPVNFIIFFLHDKKWFGVASILLGIGTEFEILVSSQP